MARWWGAAPLGKSWDQTAPVTPCSPLPALSALAQGISLLLYFIPGGVKPLSSCSGVFSRKEQCHFCGWGLYTVCPYDFCKAAVCNFFSKTPSWFSACENNPCRERLAKIWYFDRFDWYIYTFNPLWMSYLKSLQAITVCLSANAHWDLKPPFQLLSFLRATLDDSFYCTTESCREFSFSFSLISLPSFYMDLCAAALPLW